MVGERHHQLFLIWKPHLCIDALLLSVPLGVDLCSFFVLFWLAFGENLRPERDQRAAHSSTTTPHHTLRFDSTQRSMQIGRLQSTSTFIKQSTSTIRTFTRITTLIATSAFTQFTPTQPTHSVSRQPIPQQFIRPHTNMAASQEQQNNHFNLIGQSE